MRAWLFRRWFPGLVPRRGLTSPLRIVPLMGGAPRVFLARGPVKMPPWNVAWSPDGSRMVYHTSDAGDPMFVADRTGANPRQILRSNPGIHNHYPVWSRDGQWIYFVSGSPGTFQMDVWRISPNGGEPERLTQHNSEVSAPAPLDLRTIVYVARDRDGSGPGYGRSTSIARPLTGSASASKSTSPLPPAPMAVTWWQRN